MVIDAEIDAAKLRKSIDRQAIADLLYRYADGIDRRNWDVLQSCFTEDVAADYGEVGKWYSAKEITEATVELHKNMGPTLHRISNVVVDFHGDAAPSRSYVHAVLNEDKAGSRVIQAYGHYSDQLVRQKAGWKISERKFTLVAML